MNERNLTPTLYMEWKDWFLIREKAKTNERQSISSDTNAHNALREMELEVEAEGREWIWQRPQQKLQAQVEAHGAIFPPERKQGAAPKTPNDAVGHGLRRRHPKPNPCS